jgi:hypothetical protein
MKSTGTLPWASVTYLTGWMLNCSTGTVPLAVGQMLWFWHAHCGKEVRLWLNATRPGKWTGCRGPTLINIPSLNYKTGEEFRKILPDFLPRRITWSMQDFLRTVDVVKAFLWPVPSSPANYHSTSTPYWSVITDWHNRLIWGCSTKGLRFTPLPQLRWKY